MLPCPSSPRVTNTAPLTPVANPIIRGRRFCVRTPHTLTPHLMNPLDLWPWAVLIGLAFFSFYLLGPIISGLLLLLVLVGVIANIISG